MKNFKKHLLLSVLVLSIFSISGCGGDDTNTTPAINEVNKFLQDNIEIKEVNKTDDQRTTIYEIKNNSDYNFINLEVGINKDPALENSYSNEGTLDKNYYSCYENKIDLNIASKGTIYTTIGGQGLINEKDYLSIVLGDDSSECKELATNQESLTKFVEERITKDSDKLDYVNVSFNCLGKTEYLFSSSIAGVELPDGEKKQVYNWKITNNTDRKVTLDATNIVVVGGTKGFYKIEGEGTVKEEKTISLEPHGSIELGSISEPSAQYYYTSK